MTPNDQGPGTAAEYPDQMTPDQLRRYRLWRAMTDLANAQADGRLTEEQTRLLESLAASLQKLASQLSQLAELGQQFAHVLDASRASDEG